MSKELHGRPRRRLIAQVRREEPNCWICGYPIDLSLPVTDPMSSTVDERLPRALARDRKAAALTRSNVRHAHRRCNGMRGASLIPSAPEPSRRW